MASAERVGPSILVGDERAGIRTRVLSETIATNAARALWAIGLMYIVGSLADVVLLWTVSYLADPVWEYSALATTIEGTPRIVLGVALVWTAFYIRGSNSLLVQRSLAVLLVLLGIAGAVIGAMMISDYFVLRGAVVPEQQKGFAGMLLKTLTLSGLHLVLLVPIGVLGVRRPRG